jgi:hypothetical protein
MFGILQPRHRSNLTDGVGIEGLPAFLQNSN